MRKHNEILTMVADKNLSAAEAVDYHAVDVEDHTQKAWASERGLDGHQSVVATSGKLAKSSKSRETSSTRWLSTQTP